MRVELNLNQPKNTIINAARVNASFAKHGSNSKGAKSSRLTNDRLTLSPQGKLMSMIDNLSKQKQSIIDRKNDLVESTLENGGSMEDIKDQMKNYTKQLADIDKQISGLYAQQAKEAVKKDDEKKPGKSGGAKTEEEAQIQHMSSIADASNSIKQVEMVSAVKEQAEGELRVKTGEAEMSGLHIDVLGSKGPGVNVADMMENESLSLAKKEAELSNLQEKITELAADQGEKIKKAVDELEESAQPKAPAQIENAAEAAVEVQDKDRDEKAAQEAKNGEPQTSVGREETTE